MWVVYLPWVDCWPLERSLLPVNLRRKTRRTRKMRKTARSMDNWCLFSAPPPLAILMANLIANFSAKSYTRSNSVINWIFCNSPEQRPLAKQTRFSFFYLTALDKYPYQLHENMKLMTKKKKKIPACLGDAFNLPTFHQQQYEEDCWIEN